MVRVETRDLPREGVHGYAAADTLDGSGMVTAALGERVRVGVAARYGWIDRVLQAVAAPHVDAEFFIVPRYDDYQGKVQIALQTPRVARRAVFLGSHDALSGDDPRSRPRAHASETTSTGTQRFYLHYRRLLDDGARASTRSMYVGHDTSNLGAAFGTTPATLNESTLRWGLRSSYRSRVAQPVTLTLGFEVEGFSRACVPGGFAPHPAARGRRRGSSASHPGAASPRTPGPPESSTSPRTSSRPSTSVR